MYGCAKHLTNSYAKSLRTYILRLPNDCIKQTLKVKNKDEPPVPMKFQCSGCMTTPVGTGSRAQMNISPVFWMSSISVFSACL